MGMSSAGTLQMPCPRCLAPRDTMYDITTRHPLRTMETHQEMMEEVEAAVSAADAEAVKRRWSSHAVFLGMAGFALDDTDHGNLFQCSGFDTMHTDLLGTWVELMKSLKPFAAQAEAGAGTRFIRCINDRLWAMPRYHSLDCTCPVKLHPPWGECTAVQAQCSMA